MSKGSTGTQTQTSKTSLPGWVEGASLENYNMAKDVAANLKGPYEGQRVADLSPETLANIKLLQGNIGSTNPAFNAAMATTGGLASFNPSMVNPNALAGTDLSPYMNPYSSMVIDPTMRLMDQQRRQALGGVGDQALAARAFGGSRQGINEGVTNSQYALNAGNFLANLFGQNFGQAQAAAIGDITRDMQAQQFNSQQGLAGAQFRGNMASQLGNLAQQGQQNWLTGVNAAMGGQDMLYQQQQAQLDAKKALYQEQQQFPIQKLQILQNALANSPYGKETTSTGPGPQDNTAMQVAGLGLQAAGTVAAFM